ncbi:MAG: OmpA family protein, partial [Aeromonas veronii]
LAEQMKDQIQDGAIEIEALGQQIIIRIREKASFPAGSAFLQPQFWPVIRKVATLLKDVPGEITISGHTDNVATEDELFQSNWELSSQRAVAVAHQMLKVPGFDQGRLVVQGMADSQPLVPNTTPENRRMNRRVEIAIMQGKPTVSAPISVPEGK